jgi:hypothetical protein
MCGINFPLIGAKCTVRIFMMPSYSMEYTLTEFDHYLAKRGKPTRAKSLEAFETEQITLVIWFI